MSRLVLDVLTLFKLCNAKDIFEEFYMRGLSRRLLLKKSSSFESERTILTKLRTECGHDFSTKCESMLSDLTQSEHNMNEYKVMKPDCQDSLEHHIHVL